ncbi:MAG: hypothetical protein ACYDIE_09620 [Candidatus Krumholzibacteriia bacterium]
MAEHLEARGAQLAHGHSSAGAGPPHSLRHQPPRVIVTPVDEALQHPLSKRDVQLILSVLPAPSTSGLRSVSLLGARRRPDGAPVFASYRHPGFLRLHAVPKSPWLMPPLPSHTAVEFRQFGALIEMLSDGGSRVVWPGDALRLYFALGVMLPGVARHRRERDGAAELESDVRWLGEGVEAGRASAAALRQWSDLLRGRDLA